MIPFLDKAFRVGKKIIFVFAIYFIALTLFSHFFTKNKIQVDANPVKEARREIYAKIQDPKYSSTIEGKQMVALYRNGICLLMGEACTDNPSDGDRYFDKSIVGRMTNLVTIPFSNPPASGVYWAHSGLQDAGLIPKSYAAEGIGFASLRPILQLWRLFRDVVYVLLVLVLMAIGFMIMFRVKINPQTVISIENSLPRIVITLVLITFSFAIAGFLIDMMYIIMILAVSILSNAASPPLDAVTKTQLIIANPTDLLNNIFFNGEILNVGYAIFSLLPSVVSFAIRGAIIVLTVRLVWTLIPNTKTFLSDSVGLGEGVPGGGIIAWIISIAAYAVLAAILSSIAELLLSLFIMVTTSVLVFFRIFFLLFIAYIRIIMYVIFAPVMILPNAFPGKNNFMKWIKYLIADLLAFPITVIFILLSTIIVNTPATEGSLWQPPFIYSRAPTVFNILIGIGLLFVIPDVIKAVRQAFDIKESPVKFGLSTFFGGAAAIGTSGSGMFSKYMTNRYYGSQLGAKLPDGLKTTIGRIPVVRGLFGIDSKGQSGH